MAALDSEFSVVAELSISSNGDKCVLVKLQSASTEVNVRIDLPAVPRLRQVASTTWESGCLQIGTSAQSQAYWCADATTASILVGLDDQTWDFAFAFPLALLAELISEVDLALASEAESDST